MVSHDSSYNDLGTALMEQAAINIMQAAQEGARDGHISVESSPRSSHSFDIKEQVGIHSNPQRNSMPYIPATPTETLTTKQMSSEEPPLYVPPPRSPVNDHPGYPWYSAHHINQECSIQMDFSCQVPA
jgi:hypothetical protein